jgi:hypothetical protein
MNQITIIVTVLAIMITGGITTGQYAKADPVHCDMPGWPLCYDVVYPDGKVASLSGDASCPSGRSENFCNGWNLGIRL